MIDARPFDFLWPSNQAVRDYLQSHGVSLVHEPAVFGMTGPDRMSLYADGALFDSVEVPVIQIAYKAMSAEAGLAALNEATEDLCERFLIATGALHPLERRPW